MTRIVINVCHGGFGLSEEALRALGVTNTWSSEGYCFDKDRANPKLVEVVERLGRFADGPYAQLKVVEIPDGVEWEIEEYDGLEWISEKHRRWF